MTAVPRTPQSAGWPVGRMRSRAGRPALIGVGVAVGGISVMRGSEPIEGALVAAFGSIFMALAWSDLERRVIPNRLVYPALALALAVSGLWPDRGLTDALAGGVSAFVASAAIRCLGGGGLGGGDVKMAALVGTVVGGETIMLAGIATVFAGGLAAAATLADPQGRGTTSLAYGPFIAFGAVVALLA